MTDLDFGPLVLGGNVFGWTADERESFRILDAFVASGGRAIDTADVYSAWVPGNTGGDSEEIIGRWFAKSGKRDDVVIATKVFSLEARPGLSAANIAAAVDDSLRRLQTDRLDLYYAHRDDESVAQEEYLGAFDALVRAGKVREVGASNFSAERLRSAADVARANGLVPFTVVQDQWNLVERDIEGEHVATLGQLGLVELPYYSLASGFLTGKYRPGQDVDSVRGDSAKAYLERPYSAELLVTLDEVAAAHGVSVAAVSLAWLRAQPVVGAPIASARTVEQLPALVESMSLELSADEVARLGAITVPVTA
jgi:aryl-alcohol dehydrogenase-like predicted oxidoreductase